MKNISYPLPPKAIEILKTLMEITLQEESDYSYLANCCAAHGYRHAKRRFQEKSNAEEGHFDRITQLMIDRGYEPDVPATREPEIAFTDLKSGVKYALELSVETLQIFDTKIREMWAIDLCAYNEMICWLSGLLYEVKEWGDLWRNFEGLEEKEQREMEGVYFCPSTPECISG